jgi:hypothetical protein
MVRKGSVRAGGPRGPDFGPASLFHLTSLSQGSLFALYLDSPETSNSPLLPFQVRMKEPFPWQKEKRCTS